MLEQLAPSPPIPATRGTRPAETLSGALRARFCCRWPIPITPEWQRRYDELVKAQDIPAISRLRDDTAWIMVTVSMPADRAGIEATMDAVRHLVSKMQADAEAAATAEGILREWWTRQRT